ncbi:MAG: hypothetical protein GX216_10365 [Methanomicrobiales archaeon]|nr:hypothetical protein [Methanomicrobiales archaeon]
MSLRFVVIWFRQAAKALVALALFLIILPLALGSASGIPEVQVLALVSSTLVLQSNAVFAGVGMGMHPAGILAIMTSVEVGTVLAILLICDAFAHSSIRVRGILERTGAKIQKVPFLTKYGAVTLIVLPTLLVVGLYSSVVICWILRWDRIQSLFFITIGWLAASIFLMVIAFGLMRMFA